MPRIQKSVKNGSHLFLFLHFCFQFLREVFVFEKLYELVEDEASLFRRIFLERVFAQYEKKGSRLTSATSRSRKSLKKRKEGM